MKLFLNLESRNILLNRYQNAVQPLAKLDERSCVTWQIGLPVILVQARRSQGMTKHQIAGLFVLGKESDQLAPFVVLFKVVQLDCLVGV